MSTIGTATVTMTCPLAPRTESYVIRIRRVAQRFAFGFFLDGMTPSESTIVGIHRRTYI